VWGGESSLIGRKLKSSSNKKKKGAIGDKILEKELRKEGGKIPLWEAWGGNSPTESRSGEKGVFNQTFARKSGNDTELVRERSRFSREGYVHKKSHRSGRRQKKDEEEGGEGGEKQNAYARL